VADDEKWAEWEEDHRDELNAIDKLVELGHSHHCACLMILTPGQKGANE